MTRYVLRNNCVSSRLVMWGWNTSLSDTCWEVQVLISEANLLRGNQTMGQTMWRHESFPQKMYLYTKSSYHFRGLSGTMIPACPEIPNCGLKALAANMIFLHGSGKTMKIKAGLPTPLTGASSVPSDGRSMWTDDIQQSKWWYVNRNAGPHMPREQQRKWLLRES